MELNSILIPLDGSPMAELALPWASDLAQRYGAQLILFRVGIPPEVWSLQDAPEIDARMDDLETQCMKYLAHIQTQVTVPVKSEYAVGNVTQRIVERSNQPDVSLVVMNSHGRDGLTRWMIGSVAEKVARHAGCPVLLIRRPET